MNQREHKYEDIFLLQTDLFVNYVIRKALASVYIIFRHHQSAT